jgi:hypothetical protein
MFNYQTILKILLGMVFVLYLAGIHSGLPFTYEPDEPYVIKTALKLGYEKTLSPSSFVYPPLYHYLLLGLYGVSFLFLKLLLGWSTGQYIQLFFDHFEYFLVLGRLLNVLLAWGTVFFLSRWVWNLTGELKKTILFTTLVAFSGQWLYAAHFVIVDVPAFFFLALLLHQSSRKEASLVLMGIFSALAFSSKYPLVFIVPAVMFWIVIREKNFQAALPKLAQYLISAALALAICNPYFFIKFPLVLQHNSENYWALQTVSGKWLSHARALFKTIHPVGLFLMVLMLFLPKSSWLKKHTRVGTYDLFLLFFFFTYSIFLLTMDRIYPRYLFPILPMFYYFWLKALGTVADLRWRKAIIIVMLAGTFFYGLREYLPLFKTYTNLQCRNWIVANIPWDATILIDDESLFLPENQKGVRRKYEISKQLDAYKSAYYAELLKRKFPGYELTFLDRRSLKQLGQYKSRAIQYQQIREGINHEEFIRALRDAPWEYIILKKSNFYNNESSILEAGYQSVFKISKSVFQRGNDYIILKRG